MEIDEEQYISTLKSTLNSYSTISEKSWELINGILKFKTVKKGEFILRQGQTAKSIHFICKGATRSFFTDGDGNTYSKNIFMEGSFPASKVSLILDSPSNFSIEALEDTILLSFNFKMYKQFISENEDLKDFYIAYIEKNWIVVKEKREVSLVMENGTDRYLTLLEEHPEIEKRISQQHIASHLGITPTQLSRIRKSLKN